MNINNKYSNNPSTVVCHVLKLTKFLNTDINILGILATIPAIIINDTPLPTPLLVTWSPNHNNNEVPAVSITAILKYSRAPPV